jgi:hypothetical protein
MKALLVVACLLVPSPASAALITLDFNVFSGNYQYTFEGRDAYRQDVYTPQHGIAMPGVLMFDSLFAQMFNDALAANYTTNGTGIGAIPLNGTILSTGQPFTLLAFDLLPHWPAESAGADVRLTGMRGDATTGSLLITGRDSHTWRTISGESLGLVDRPHRSSGSTISGWIVQTLLPCPSPLKQRVCPRLTPCCCCCLESACRCFDVVRTKRPTSRPRIASRQDMQWRG